jgi:8-oxo-dGTP diphosphatase
MIITQKAVIRREKKVLFLRRRDDEPAFPGLWDLPGGKLEAGEDPKAGLKRESREETNYSVEPCDDPMGVYYGQVQPGRDVEFRVFDTVSYEGRFRRNREEHADHCWKEPSQMRGRRTMPFMEQFIDDFYKRENSE